MIMKYEYGEYLITEGEKFWKVKRNSGIVRVEYKVSKELADTLEDLKKYITDHPEIF